MKNKNQKKRKSEEFRKFPMTTRSSVPSPTRMNNNQNQRQLIDLVDLELEVEDNSNDDDSITIIELESEISQINVNTTKRTSKKIKFEENLHLPISTATASTSETSLSLPPPPPPPPKKSKLRMGFNETREEGELSITIIDDDDNPQQPLPQKKFLIPDLSMISEGGLSEYFPNDTVNTIIEDPDKTLSIESPLPSTVPHPPQDKSQNETIVISDDEEDRDRPVITYQSPEIPQTHTNSDEVEVVGIISRPKRSTRRSSKLNKLSHTRLKRLSTQIPRPILNDIVKKVQNSKGQNGNQNQPNSARKTIDKIRNKIKSPRYFNAIANAQNAGISTGSGTNRRKNRRSFRKRGKSNLINRNQYSPQSSPSPQKKGSNNQNPFYPMQGSVPLFPRVIHNPNATRPTSRALMDNNIRRINRNMFLNHNHPHQSTNSTNFNLTNNLYNPEGKTVRKTGSVRPIVIDASNVAMEHGKKYTVGRGGTPPFSCTGIKICVDYFKNLGHKEIIAFLPRWRLKSGQSRDTGILHNLEKEGIVKFTPSREVDTLTITSYDDRFIIQHAKECEGIVVSCDNYRDLYAENEGFREVIRDRILQFVWVNDTIMFPVDPLGKNGPNLQEFLRF